MIFLSKYYSKINDPIFYLLFKLYVLVHFILAFQDLQNSIIWGPPFHYVAVSKIQSIHKKFFVMLSRFWTLRAVGGETSLSESFEKETFLTKMFFQIMLNEVLYVKK